MKMNYEKKMRMQTDFDIDLIGKEDMFVCGDCMEYMKQIPDECIDLAVCDPPYGLGEANQTKNKGRSMLAISKEYPTIAGLDNQIPDKSYFDELLRISKNVIIWGGNYFSSMLPNSSCWIVWNKDNGENDFADCELAWTSFDKAVRMFTFRWQGMLQGDMKNKEKRIHVMQKPVALYEWILQRYANPGDTILDTHVGSASSLIACHNTNHRFVGFELSKEYYGLAKDRYESETSQMRLTDLIGE